MTDSGQNPESPPDPNKPVVPSWAPEPVVGPPPAAPPPPPPPDPYAVEATMRLIPVPHIPPPAPAVAPAPVAAPAAAAPTAEQQPAQPFAVMHGVLQALDYAHKSASVHRDMKPENVLMSDEGDVKVADFGIARLMDDSGAGSTATKTGTTVGTPQYMSPEQVASSKVDGRSDLYSAGIMFYELVVGQPPFTASDADGPLTLMAKHVQAPPKPPSVHRPGLDMSLEEVILKSLSKRPEERYQTGQEFDDAMIRIADRLTPGWQRSLQPGADLAKMVPGATPYPGALPAMAGMPVMPSASPLPAQPVQSVYNPTPPVRPVAKKTSGCLGIMAGTLSLIALVGGLLATLPR